jgi:hypothetical protein
MVRPLDSPSLDSPYLVGHPSGVASFNKFRSGQLARRRHEIGLWRGGKPVGRHHTLVPIALTMLIRHDRQSRDDSARHARFRLGDGRHVFPSVWLPDWTLIPSGAFPKQWQAEASSVRAPAMPCSGQKGSARSRAGPVERDNLSTSGWFGLTDGFCVRRISQGAEQFGYAAIVRLGKV